MPSLLDILLGRNDTPVLPPRDGIGSLGQVPFRYAGNAVGTETTAGIEPRPIDRFMARAEAPDVQNMTAIGMGLDAGPMASIRAYHGSPHMFDRFDMSKIGTGEGAQAYGHGLYFAGKEGTARFYRDALSPPHGLNKSVLIDGTPLGEMPEYLAMNPLARARAANAIAAGGDKGSWLQYAEAANAADPFAAQITPSGKTKAELVHAPALDFLNTIDPSRVTRAQHPGHMYEVNINARPEQLLDWDKPLAGQNPQIQSALERIGVPRDTPQPYTGLPLANGAKLRVETDPDFGPRYFMDMPSGGSFRINASDLSNLIGPAGGQLHGKAAWSNVAGRLGEQDASVALRDAGIPGIQYLDAGSRGAGEGSRNYVIFDDKLIDILRRYAFPGMVGAGAAAGATNAEQVP